MKIQIFIILIVSCAFLGFAPDQSKIFYDQGLQFKAANRLDQAEESFKKAIELNSKIPDYHFELSNIYAVRYDRLRHHKSDSLSDGMLSNCQRELELTLVLNPTFLPAIYNLGVVYKNKGEFEHAREQFRKVLQKDPKQINAYLEIATTYEAQGFYDEARDMFKQAKDLDANNLDIEGAVQDLNKLEQEDKENRRNSLRMPPGLFSGGRYQSPYMVPSSTVNEPDDEEQRTAIPAAGMMAAQQLFQSFRKKE